MLNFKNEYYLLEKGRVLYPTAFKDKSSIEVYGAKTGGITGTEDTAHVFKVPSNHYTLNAGNIDFSGYPNGIDKDFKSIKIVNVENLISLPVNFNEFKDITPENLKMSFELLGNSLKDVQKRLSEVGLYIDSNLPGEIGLPKLPVGCTWYCNQDGHITAMPISDLYEKFQQMMDNLYNQIKDRLDKDYDAFMANFLKEVEKIKEQIKVEVEKYGKDKIDTHVETVSKPEIDRYVEEKMNEIHGEKGDKGDRGASIASIKFKELAPNRSNVYTVFTDEGNAVGDFTANIGPHGDTGAQGIQGIQGIPGAKGDKGDVGPQGTKGDTGATGSQGVQGERGDQGIQGIPGPQGIQGSKGERGEQGVQGEVGPQGAQGVQGAKGDKGDKGEPGAPGAVIEGTGLYAFQVRDGNLYLIYQGKERPNFYLDENGNLIYSTEPYFPQQKKLVVNLTQDDFKNNRVGDVKLYNGNNLLTTFGNNKNESYNENDLCYNSQEGFFFIGRNQESVYIDVKELNLFNATKKLTIEFQFSQTDIADEWSNPLFLTSMENFIHDAGDTSYRTTSGIRLEWFDRNGSLYFCPSPYSDGTDGKIKPVGTINNLKHSVIIMVENTKAIVYFDYAKVGECNIHEIPKINFIGLNKGNTTKRCCNMKIYGLKAWKDVILTEQEIEYLKNEVM